MIICFMAYICYLGQLTDGKEVVGKQPVLLGATLLIWYEPWMANIIFEKSALKHDNLRGKSILTM